ncbi:MAG TPA: nodulation protein NfeD [Bryobacteraceae bacterium]|nr:nodulation protein NfeD [Bryobacteraceae bacterium]
MLAVQSRYVGPILLALTAASMQAAPRVLAVDVDGMIHPVTVEILSHAIAQAKQDGDSVLLVRLNTPGGLMDAMRQSIEAIVAAPMPVVTYVTPSGARAASAGFFILEAGDVAAMAPGTNTGAAHPVVMGGEVDAVMKQKIENDAAAELRSITVKRGRNSALAEKAIRESQSFTDKEALDNHLIELVANSDQDLLDKLDGREITRLDGVRVVLHTRGAAIDVYQRNLRQRIISAIADPNVALILLVLGALGIYVEFTSPGLIVPGIIGAILALLGLSALSVLPINWLGAALLLLAFALFVLEAKFATHGILGIGGAVSMVLGAVMLINSPLPEMRIHLSTAIALALPFSLITMVLLSLVVRARQSKVVTGREAMLGETGTALTSLSPGGKVFVRGEYWDAVASGPVAAGTPVRVIGIDKLKLSVEAAPPQNGASI